MNRKYLVIVLILFSFPVLAQQCVTGYGGTTVDAEKACANEQPRCWSGQFFSSDTLALCAPGAKIAPDSVWNFHESSTWVGNVMISPHSLAADTILWSCYNRFPALAARLQRLHALHSQHFTKISGKELGRLGIPLCD